MAVDASMRKLQVPPKFMPYLEKHRIYELFHDLANELVIRQPQDPLKFLKSSLEKMDKVRDKKLIFLLCPPYLDRIRLAHLISVKTGCGILSRYVLCKNLYDSECLAEQAVNMIRSTEKNGWILSDFPDTEDEAKSLLSNGVLPTHVFLLAPELDNNKKENDDVRTVKVTPSDLLDFNHNFAIWKELFKTSVKVVNIKDKDLDQLASSCARLTMKMPPRYYPKVFRIALLGPRGSRRRTVARILQNKFQIVHIDMEVLLSAARNLDNELGEHIRFLDDDHVPYQRKIVFNLLKGRLSQNDCMERGYVLTNFPRSIEDFVLLDTIDNPPNRVIFLEIDGSECKARLEDRVVNTYTGSLHSECKIKKDPALKSRTLKHPDDESCKVDEEVKFYNKRVEAMLDYCGGTCFRVNARGPLATLAERVEAVMMGPPPTAKARSWLPPSHFLSESQSTEYKSQTKVSTRMTYPLTRSEVIPLIDSEELLKRFWKLKKGPQKTHCVTLASSEASGDVDVAYMGDAESTDSSITSDLQLQDISLTDSHSRIFAYSSDEDHHRSVSYIKDSSFS